MCGIYLSVVNCLLWVWSQNFSSFEGAVLIFTLAAMLELILAPALTRYVHMSTSGISHAGDPQSHVHGMAKSMWFIFLITWLNPQCLDKILRHLPFNCIILR